MKCGKCGYPDSRVVQSDLVDMETRRVRRRECLRCLARFTTEELTRPPKAAKLKEPAK